MLNSATGEVTFGFAGPNSWSYVEVPSRDSVIAASFASDETTVYSLSQASARNEWESDVEGLWRISFIGGTNRIIASSRQSYVVTDLDSESRTTVQESNELFWFVNSSQTGEYVATPTADRWELRDARTGETLYVAQDGYRIHGVAPDGSSVVILREGLDGCDDTALVDIDSGTIRHEWNMGCAGMATYSHAGDLVAIGGRTNPGMTVFDTVSGDQIVSLTGTEYDSLAADFSTDGSLMLAGSFGGSAYVFDVAKLRAELPLEEALVLTLPAHDSLILQAMFSPDGSLIATAAIGEEPAKLWDLASGELLGEFGGTITGGGLHAVDFHPTEPLLAVTTPPSQVAIHSLDTEALIATAKASLSHRMTEDECQTYLRRSCSTDD